MADWIPYDYEDKKANPLPKSGELVWIHDEFYEGVTIGVWNGWWESAAGSDDISVTHWTPLTKPEPPK